mgnify:FL=1
MSKCPPGVICIENVSMFMLFLVILPIIYIIYYIHQNRKINQQENPNTNIYISPSNQTSQQDMYENPYRPPLKNNMDFLLPQFSQDVRGAIPINVPTQSVDTTYRQVGILTRGGNSETILPLMGRALYTNRDKWQYYSMNDKNNAIKLPISFQGKSCTNEYGCNSLNNGDTIYVEGYQDVFRVTMYENNTMQYIPVI